MYILYFRVWDDSVHHSETSAESSFLPDVRSLVNSKRDENSNL